MEDIVQLVTLDEDGAVQCEACHWRCRLKPEEYGRCRMRIGADGGLQLLNYGLVSAATIGPIEDFRFWHFFPETKVLSIGGWGYAFPADQQRGQYADLPADESKRRRLEPDRAASVALDKLCRGVIWAYAEPAVAFEFVRDILQLSRAASRFTAIVTSGYMTLEALDNIGHYLDGLNLDLRGFSDLSYSRLADAPDWQQILQVAEHALRRWQCHIEVTTRLHHGVNDNPDELRAMVDWIGSTLGMHTPWHVLPGDMGSETAAAVVRARRIGHEQGLQFVYGPETNQITRCPSCQSALITRDNQLTRVVGLNGDQCSNCGTQIYLRHSIFKARSS
jgi:pyruvate formate lyase activating enzyme